MDKLRLAIARIVDAHLDEILDRIMDAFRAEVPSLAAVEERVVAGVRASTRQALLAFLALYANPGSPARPLLDEARRATMDRAGGSFSREEIVQMLRVARHTILQQTRTYVAAELAGDAEADDLAAAMEAFLAELQRTESDLEIKDPPMHRLLMEAEMEEPDLE